MTDERKDEPPAASADERPKRAPPTIDLEASEVSGDTRAKDGAFFKGAGEKLSAAGARLRPLLAAVSGAIAALLVFAAFWAAGLIGPPQAVQTSVSPLQFDNVAANVGDLTARLARVEATAVKTPSPATDTALAGRTDALETSLAAARDEVAKLGTELRNVAASLSDVRAMPRDGAAPDLAPLNERLARLEAATNALAAQLAKPAASADDINVRRLVVANMLDAAVRRGEPYATALAAAKQLSASPAALAPLDAFAAKGIPPEATFLREIVPVLQRLADANAAASKQAVTTPATPGAGAGVLDRLQSGLTKLVRVERDGGTVTKDTAPAPTAAVRRDDLVATRQDVAKLPQAADPQIQAWIKSVDAREAALATAQKFSTEALAAFSKSGQ